MSDGVKKIVIIAVDVCLAAYIIVAVCAFHNSSDPKNVCKGVSVLIADGNTHGFIDRQEVVSRVKKAGLYPTGKALSEIDCREIEDALLATPFIRTTQCYTTIDGIVNIEITQRTPVVRIKSANNDDFYIDDKDCIMPISNFTSDILIATGNIDRTFATAYVAPMARALADDDFCRNLFQQINITEDKRVELIPQVGNNIISLGHLPANNDRQARERDIEEYVGRKINTLRTFYKYGLPKAGWNRYSVINLEFDNQIVCKRRKANDLS